MYYDYVCVTGDVDYIPGPYTVIIPAGVTNVHFNISLLHNDKESYREFTIFIVYSNELLIGKYSQAAVAIIPSSGRYNIALVKLLHKIILMFCVLELYCNQMSDVYFGLRVTWDRTPAGITTQSDCNGNELTGKRIVKYITT